LQPFGNRNTVYTNLTNLTKSTAVKLQRDYVYTKKKLPENAAADNDGPAH